MINSKSVKTEDGSPRFIEAKLRNRNIEESDALVYTKLFHNLVKHIDHHKPTIKYDIITNIWKSYNKTYIEIDIKRKCEKGIMFYVLKKFIDRLKENDINIWSILPAEENPIEGFITLNGGFED